MEQGFDDRDYGGTRGSARPELAHLMQSARDGEVEYVLVRHHDSLSRDPSERNEILQELNQLGIDVQIRDSAEPEGDEKG